LHVTAMDGSPLAKLEVEAQEDEVDPRFYLPADAPAAAKLAPLKYPTVRLGDGIFRLLLIQGGRPFTIKVKADGYEPATRKVTLPAGEHKRIDITLQKQK